MTCQRIPLNTLTLLIKSENVYTSQGVPVSVTGVAQVKINGENDEMVRTAAEQFGSKSEDEIHHIALETLEGHQRAMMGNMTVEEIYRDRKTFAEAVFNTAKHARRAKGLDVYEACAAEVDQPCSPILQATLAWTPDLH